jgi:hypothetical protein
MQNESASAGVVPATVLTSRSTGVVLLLAVLVGSLLVSRIGGARVAGTAMAQPGSGAPAVGECVGSIVGLPMMPMFAAPPSPVSIATVGETSAIFASCSAPHVGEVVAYLSLVATPDTQSPTATFGADAPSAAVQPTATAAAAAVSDGQWCQMVAGTYREQTVLRYGYGQDPQWAPSIGQRFVAILSAPTPDPTGPRWAACALLSPGLEPYSGSYVRSLAGLPAPAPFGLCRTAEPTDQWVSCIAPHRSQVFGTAVQRDVSPDEQTASCRSLIERMTRMQDVTNDGVLRVEVTGAPARNGSGGNSGTPDPASILDCRLTVVGAGDLVGTLVGIGSRPLPMA